jgi:hypothetical protein
MRYAYRWREVPDDDPDIVYTQANGDLKIETDEGKLLLFEEHVPLLELAYAMENWDREENFSYNPDGYAANPMLSFRKVANGYSVESPDLRDRGETVELSTQEVSAFITKLYEDVVKDVPDGAPS